MTSSVVRPPPPPPPPLQAGRARRAATGRRPDQLGRGPTSEEERRRRRPRAGRTERLVDEKEQMREKRGRPKAGGVRPRVGQGCGSSTAAGEASAGLKIEGVNDVQRVESLAERTNRLP